MTLDNAKLMTSSAVGSGLDKKTQPNIIVNSGISTSGSKARPARESEETLLAAVLLKHAIGPSRQFIAVTSLDQGDRAGALVARTGSSLAEIVNEDILLLHANSSCSQLSDELAVSAGPGLQEVLEGHSSIVDAVRNLNASNLWFLSLGKSDRSLASMLSSIGWTNTVRNLRERFRYILVDVGPVSSPECVLIASVSDGVVLALATGRAKQDASRIRDEFKHLEIPVLGVMLTERRSGKR